MSYYILPIFLMMIFMFSLKNKSNAYDNFIEGCLEGMKTAFKLFPYILAMYFAIELLSVSHIFQDLLQNIVFIPLELLLQGIFRPLSGNASLVNMLTIYQQYGIDSKEGIISSILQGSTDTTLFIISLYFGSIGIKKTRHVLKTSLLTDFITFIICVLIYLFVLK